ncbi:MAG: RNA polymerase sigma-54 factor, partial [Candidatus Lokiarchaeota archaeon]|nr:RNA polymerase sigma-54 factor [Candidatus Lokiarchaeota archaeon]
SLLEPKPARAYSSVENSYVIADVAIKRVDGSLQLVINDDIIPDISFNDEYKKFLSVKNNPELKRYLIEKEERAVSLLTSIRYRQTNLEKVMKRLLEVQYDFFDKGPGHLVPYTLKKLSEEIEVNSGTLSRIINAKYVQTEWGVFSLRIFFSSSLRAREGDVSSNTVKDMIMEIIDSYEDSQKLSDQKIVEVLAKRGIKVARRTVAKYRKKLNILSSFHR